MSEVRELVRYDQQFQLAGNGSAHRLVGKTDTNILKRPYSKKS